MTARDEALNAIETVEKMLASPEPMTPLQKKLALATLEHAKDRVGAIEELKHRRRVKKAATA